jgi:hypothetical protein
MTQFKVGRFPMRGWILKIVYECKNNITEWRIIDLSKHRFIRFFQIIYYKIRYK